MFKKSSREHIDGLMQDCSNSIADAMELLQSCTKPLIYVVWNLNCVISNTHALDIP